MDELLTVDDLAKRWKSSKSYIYLLSSSGQLRKIKIGNLLRFRLEDVEEHERQSTVEAREAVVV